MIKPRIAVRVPRRAVGAASPGEVATLVGVSEPPRLLLLVSSREHRRSSLCRDCAARPAVPAVARNRHAYKIAEITAALPHHSSSENACGCCIANRRRGLIIPPAVPRPARLPTSNRRGPTRSVTVVRCGTAYMTRGGGLRFLLYSERSKRAKMGRRRRPSCALFGQGFSVRTVDGVRWIGCSGRELPSICPGDVPATARRERKYIIMLTAGGKSMIVG